MIDIFKVNSNSPNQYDLPIWFQGHLLETNFDYESELTGLSTLGEGHGYQHLWKEAVGKPSGEDAKISWFSNGKFYSMTSVVNKTDDLIFARIGANDPEFNLRHDPTFIIRKKNSKNATFVSIIEPHGAYNPVAEIPTHPFTSIEKLELLIDEAAYTAIRFSNKAKKQWVLILANTNASKKAKHQLEISGKMYEWTGPFKLMDEK